MNPLAPKPPHRKDAKAKSVIFLFMAGGPSHLDTFDPKPLLNKLNGQKRPAEFGEAKYQFVNNESRLLGTKRTFKRYGKSGIEVSDLFPHLAECIDDIAVIRSCHGDMVVHSAAQYQLFTGRVIPGFPEHGLVDALRPGLGERIAARLRRDARSEGRAGSRPADVHQRLPARGLPADHVPPRRTAGAEPRPAHRESTVEDRRKTLDLIRDLNEADMEPDDTEFARASERLRPRVQDADRSARDLRPLQRVRRRRSTCTASAKQPTDDYGRRCLLARRLVEKGVRFVCPVSGGGPGNMQWDAHDDIEENHLRMAAQTDQPVAALLKDLKRRGLLDSTLVMCGGEFGRSPESQGSKGRDHHNLGFTM